MKDALELEREDERLKALHASVSASVEKHKELEAWCTLKFSWKLYCCSSMRLKALHASVTASVEQQKELQAWFTFKFSWILVWKCNSGSYALVSLRVPYETAGADNTFALHFPLSAGAQRDLKKHHNNHLRVQKMDLVRECSPIDLTIQMKLWIMKWHERIHPYMPRWYTSENLKHIILAAPSKKRRKLGNHHFSAYMLHLLRTSAEERVQTLEMETKELRRGRDATAK